jgi:hypothetical protein
MNGRNPAWQMNDNTIFDLRLNVVRNAAGYFWSFYSKVGFARFPSGLCFIDFTDVRVTGDLYPVFAMGDYNSTTGSGQNGVYNPAASSIILASGPKGRSPTGAATGYVGPLGYKGNSNTDPLAASGITTNVDGVADDLPVYVWSYIASYQGKRGRLRDVQYGGSANAQGSTVLDASGNVVQVLVGGMFLPFQVQPVT